MGDQGMNKALKSMGRNLAKVANQKKSAVIPMKYSKGGIVGTPVSKPPVKRPVETLAAEDIPLMRSSGFGSGTSRGMGAATKGGKFSGTF